MLDYLIKLDRIHPYPAKFTVNLALEYIEKYTNIGDVIYDPFVGSGTTVLAASYLGREGIGTDINHIAILISKFKILNLQKDEMEQIVKFYEFTSKLTDEKVYQDIKQVYEFHSIDHWFQKDMIVFLSFIKYEILNYAKENDNIRTFLNLILSSVITTLSNQDSDTRYAAITKDKLNITYAIDVFSKKLYSAIQIFKNINIPSNYLTKSKVYLEDAKEIGKLLENRNVDLIFTSPPYPNTYDYYLYHKHRMNWLGYDVKYSMEKEIGSRREFSSLKRPIENFNNDMFVILSESNKILKPNGIVVLVMGDGKVQGEKYDAKINMQVLGEKLGWELIDYSYSLLDDTSRSFQQSYRTRGKKEHIIVFKKVN